MSAKYSQNDYRYKDNDEYDADSSRDVAARNPNIKLEPRDDVITRNSPTNPDVPGKPEFAIRKKIIIKEKIGINLATP